MLLEGWLPWMAGHKNVGSVFRASPGGVKRMDALSIKKKTPRLRGFCRLFADILDLLAVLAAIPRIPFIQCASCATS